MADPLPLSVAVITLNEEANLPRCLASVRGLAGEIVVVDSGSTDGTESIARSHGARFERVVWPGHVAQKNNALRCCTQPWVLCLDADEALSPELAAALPRRLQAAESLPAGFALNRRTFYLGDWIWHSWYPEWRVRLVRRDAASWAGLDPHDRLEVAGPVERLQGDLLHYSFRDLEDHYRRSIIYARISAASYAAAGRRFRWSQLALSPWFAAVKHLVVRQGFRDGWRGWVIAGVKWAETFAKYAFLLERERATRAGPSSGEA